MSRNVRLVSSAYLPEARHARLDREAPVPVPLVVIDFVRDGRPRAHERHVAREDVVELRQLIDAPSAEEPPHRRDPLVVLELVQRAPGAVGSLGLAGDQPDDVVLVGFGAGVGAHRAELVQREPPHAGAHTALAEQDRSARVEFDRERDRDERRHEQDEQDRGRDEVECATDHRRRGRAAQPESSATASVTLCASIRTSGGELRRVGDEVVRGPSHPVDLIRGHGRGHRQRADLIGQALRDRERSAAQPKSCERLGSVDWNRIVDRARHAVTIEVLAQGVAVGALDDELVKDVVLTRLGRGRWPDRRGAQRLSQSHPDPRRAAFHSSRRRSFTRRTAAWMPSSRAVVPTRRCR